MGKDYFYNVQTVFETVILCPKDVGNGLHLDELFRWSQSLSHVYPEEPRRSYPSAARTLQFVCRSYEIPVSRLCFGTHNDILILDLDKKMDMHWFLSLRSRLPDCGIPWDDIEDDLRLERNIDWQLGVQNSWRTDVSRSEGHNRVRIGDDDGKNVRHLDLPAFVQVDVLDLISNTWVDADDISDSFYGYFWFMMPWADYATLLSHIWALSIGIKTFPEVQRVVKIHLQG